MNAGDVWMIQRGQRAGFALEARQALLIRREGVGQHLQRDGPVKMDVTRLVHGAHPTFTDLFDDLVVTDRSADQVGSSAALLYQLGRVL